MTALATPPKLQFLDSNGAPLVGGKLYTYAAGTTTPLTTYTDFGGVTANANPVILDSRGEASVWLGTSLYKMALYSATDVLIWTVDNIDGFATLTQLTALQAQDANLTALVSINGGQIAGLRNRVINGRIAVDQRNAGASQTITGGTGYTGSAYTVDRWAAFSAGSTGATFTAQRTGAAPYSLSLSVTAINFGTLLGVYQRIEAINCTDLANQSVTISASISCDSSQTITWIAYYPNTKDTWTGPGVSSGPSTGATQIATGTWSATTTPTRFSATFTNASSLNGLQIVIQRSISANAQTLVVTDVQFELGSVATIFEQRPYGMELALCQRYYQTQPLLNLVGYQAAGTPFGTTIYLPVTMRSTPTAAAVSIIYSNSSSLSINPSTTNIRSQVITTALGVVQITADITLSSEL